ncbi:MAG TPA: RidA family protein [Myxococcales bacterium]|nr:RidA family protein [Myxococcales bacterium]HIN86275.1 RidA family protein [Myxococcales bacterium]
MKVINTENAPAAIGPYSQATAINGLVFCSGQIAIDPATGRLISGNAATQTQQVMNNLKAVLAAADCSMAAIVKTTIYLRDMNDFGAVNEVYAECLNGHRPARATIEVSRLPKEALVEIDAIAAKECCP